MYFFKEISKHKNLLIKYLYFIFIFVASLIFLKVIHNFLNHGSDFDIPYKLSKLFWEGTNIFDNTLDNPLYPHSLYILFFPLTILDLFLAKTIFFSLNVLLLIIGSIQLSKIFNLSVFQKYLLIFISFTATPFTNILAIGNLSLIVYVSLIFYYSTHSKILKSILLTIAFIKYNISFIFVLHAIFNKEYKVLFYFILINLLFVFIYYLYLDISLIKNFLDPFLLAFELIQGKSSAEGYTNNISKTFFSIHSALIYLGLNKIYPFIFFILILLSSYLIFLKKFDYHTQMVFLFLSSSLFVYHTMYDYIILLPLVAYFLKYKDQKKYSICYLISVIFIFYIFKINKLIFNNLISDDIMSLLGCLFLSISLIIMIYTNHNEIK